MKYQVVNVTDVDQLNCSSTANVVCVNVCICQEPEPGITIQAGVIVPLVVAGVLIIAVLAYAKFQSNRFRVYDAYTAEKLEFGPEALYRKESIKYLDAERNQYLDAHSTEIDTFDNSDGTKYGNGDYIISEGTEKHQSFSKERRPFTIVAHVAETHSTTEAAIGDEQHSTSDNTESETMTPIHNDDISKSVSNESQSLNTSQTSNATPNIKVADEDIPSSVKDS